MQNILPFGRHCHYERCKVPQNKHFLQQVQLWIRTLLVAIWGCVTYDFADRTGLTQRKEGAELRFSTLLWSSKNNFTFRAPSFRSGLGFGLVSPEIHIERHRMFRSAFGKDILSEGGGSLRVEDARLLE